MSNMRHQTRIIRHEASGMRHQTRGIRHEASDMRHRVQFYQQQAVFCSIFLELHHSHWVRQLGIPHPIFLTVFHYISVNWRHKLCFFYSFSFSYKDSPHKERPPNLLHNSTYPRHYKAWSRNTCSAPTWPHYHLHCRLLQISGHQLSNSGPLDWTPSGVLSTVAQASTNTNSKFPYTCHRNPGNNRPRKVYVILRVRVCVFSENIEIGKILMIFFSIS